MDARGGCIGRVVDLVVVVVVVVVIQASMVQKGFNSVIRGLIVFLKMNLCRDVDDDDLQAEILTIEIP